MLDTAKQARERGLSEEQKIKQWLIKEYPNGKFRDSSKDEDINQDIDLWWEDIPISIKVQEEAIISGNLSFELEKMNRHGYWQDSWFNLGKADFY
ncbi:MAG: hypothetical protein AABY22_20560, partial [Nanoarchaeota archaeon]